jgi:hypothetical protein
MERLNRGRVHPVLPALANTRGQLQQRLSDLEESERTEENLLKIKATEEEIERLGRRYEELKAYMERDMNEALGCWARIKAARRATGLVNVPLKLAVKEYEAEGKLQIFLALANDKVSLDKTRNGTDLPESEVSRRESIRAETYYCRLLVNNEVVGQTSPCCLTWPNF